MQTRSNAQSRIDNRRADVVNQIGERRGTALDPQRQRAQSVARREEFGARLNEHMAQRDFRGGNIAERTLHTESLGYRRPYLHASYHDRPDLIMYHPHHLYSYYDWHHNLCHRVIYPSFYFAVGYHFGPYFCYDYVYPYYHRKYVFISLGGYWPDDYDYMRYYWYGYHPYVWYGYYPVATEVAGETNNYYTYNYYNDDGSVTSYQSADNSGGYVDHNTFADVRAKLAKKPEPAAQTQADTRFEEGVKSFESGNYAVAADQFAKAMELSPEDTILPFAYAQALFADGRYSQAAEVLRQALRNVTPEKEGVFYPRGLYANDDVLFKQIETLMNKQDESSDNADLQLLLGYHLLGTGETGYAREPLELASRDAKNAEAAGVLLQLLDKTEKEAGPADKAGAEPQAAPQVQPQTQSSMPSQAEPATIAPPVSPLEAPAPQVTPDTQTVPDAGSKDSASQLTTGTGTPQTPEQQPANKENGNELQTIQQD
jgi:Tfp pilus assembly protein PilF